MSSVRRRQLVAAEARLGEPCAASFNESDDPGPVDDEADNTADRDEDDSDAEMDDEDGDEDGDD